jgi:molecular chaperone DnaK (HSP70)
MSHVKSKKEGCIETTIEKELSDDDDSSFESEDEEYANVIKEFKNLLKKRQRAQYKRKTT